MPKTQNQRNLIKSALLFAVLAVAGCTTSNVSTDNSAAPVQVPAETTEALVQELSPSEVSTSTSCIDCDQSLPAAEVLPAPCRTVISDEEPSSLIGLAGLDFLVGFDPTTHQLHPLPVTTGDATDIAGWRSLELSASDDSLGVWDSSTGVRTPLSQEFPVQAVNWIENDIVALTIDWIDNDTGGATRVFAHRVAADGSVLWSVDLNPDLAPLVPYRTISSGNQLLVGFAFIEGGALPASWILINADGTIAWSTGSENYEAGAGLSADGLIRIETERLILADGTEISVPGAIDIAAATTDHVIVSDADAQLSLVTIATREVDNIDLPDGCHLSPLQNTFVGTSRSPQQQLEQLIQSAGFQTGPGMHDSHPAVEVISEDPSIIAESFPITFDVVSLEGQVVLDCEPQRLRLLLSEVPSPEPVVDKIAQLIVEADVGCLRSA